MTARRHPFMTARLAHAASSPELFGLVPTRTCDGYRATVEGHRVVIRCTELPKPVRRRLGAPVLFEVQIDGVIGDCHRYVEDALTDARGWLRQLRRSR